MNEHRYAPEHIDLGVLGGMGPRATQYFVAEFLKAVETRRRPQRDQEYPNIVVRYACYLPDRTTALEADVEPFARAFMREAEFLLKLGCPQIVVPCITAHAVIESRLADWPVVNIPRIVAAHLRREKPQARVGVLATSGAHRAGIVEKFAANVVTLEPVEQAALMSLIYQKAKTWQGLMDGSEIAAFADRLRDRGCDVVIAGCTELEMCLAHSGCERADLIFPLRIVAETLVP